MRTSVTGNVGQRDEDEDEDEEGDEGPGVFKC